ncbi:MAG TPA: NADPH-dependent FMN reductase [Flavipsychrobacter sp.]|nr:NADPH-dependent FMN reductase [Flavipsychrobacter sp.]
MKKKTNIFAIIGSASSNSANQKLVECIAALTTEQWEITVFTQLKDLPHFDPELSLYHPPELVIAFRESVANADAILVCTPEYVFSIPSGLKNAIEWCVATTVFSDKPTGLITASADGRKGHEELQLLMKTLGCRFLEETTLLISGVKSKITEAGAIGDDKTYQHLVQFIDAFRQLINEDAINTNLSPF